jgi:hypothetical protein
MFAGRRAFGQFHLFRREASVERRRRGVHTSLGQRPRNWVRPKRGSLLTAHVACVARQRRGVHTSLGQRPRNWVRPKRGSLLTAHVVCVERQRRGVHTSLGQRPRNWVRPKRSAESAIHLALRGLPGTRALSRAFRARSGYDRKSWDVAPGLHEATPWALTPTDDGQRKLLVGSDEPPVFSQTYSLLQKEETRLLRRQGK